MRLTPLGITIIGFIILGIGAFDNLWNGVELLGYACFYWAACRYFYNKWYGSEK